MVAMKKTILTGDRPTGKLHLGHYVGSLKKRVELQNSDEYNTFIMIADLQALTDNAKNPQKIQDNLLEVAMDYLAVGLDPTKTTIFVQSQIPALSELTMYYMNLVTLSRVLRNPTVKTEIMQKGWSKVAKEINPQSMPVGEILRATADELLHDLQKQRVGYVGTPSGETVPAGFAMYPISQAADITAFKANLVPVGVDQLPMIEQTREIVRSFNATYGDILIEPEGLVPEGAAKRLPGIYGVDDKMSKSLNNGIYLSDDSKTVKEKVMTMFTDPDHIRVEDPGKIEGNVVFAYLDVFASNTDKVAELKEQYQKGGLGDVTVKKYLIEVLEEILTPIREKRAYYEQNLDEVREILRTGSTKANIVANQTLAEVRNAIGVNYFGE